MDELKHIPDSGIEIYTNPAKNAMAFRQWSNKVLKDYIIKGYAINEKIKLQRYEELKEVVALMSRTISLQENQ